MKPSQVQLIRVVLLGIGVVALLLLAMGISQIELVPGVPFEQIWQFLMQQLAGALGPRGGMAPVGGDAELLIAIIRTLFLVALVAFPFAVVMIIVDPDLRKRMLRTILVMILIMALVSAWFSNLAEVAEEELDIFSGLGGQGDELGAADPFTDEEFSIDRVPPWIPLVLSLGAGLLIAAVVVTVVRQIRRTRAERDSTLTELARQAEIAIGELEQGGDLQNTILRCYAEMTRIVREQRGLRRGSTVTAREFTEHLIRANMPPSAVNRLTQLFEGARYGLNKPGPQDEADAIASLQMIIDTCRTAA
jgi:hypothetical protein